MPLLHSEAKAEVQMRYKMEPMWPRPTVSAFYWNVFKRASVDTWELLHAMHVRTALVAVIAASIVWWLYGRSVGEHLAQVLEALFLYTGVLVLVGTLIVMLAWSNYRTFVDALVFVIPPIVRWEVETYQAGHHRAIALQIVNDGAERIHKCTIYLRRVYRVGNGAEPFAALTPADSFQPAFFVWPESHGAGRELDITTRATMDVVVVGRPYYGRYHINVGDPAGLYWLDEAHRYVLELEIATENAGNTVARLLVEVPVQPQDQGIDGFSTDDAPPPAIRSSVWNL